MTIGEAAARSGVPAKTIRYYEETGLIGRAGRGPNLYRTYGEDDVAMLRFVGRARRLGFSIEDIKALISLYRDRSRSSRDVRIVASQHLRRVEHKIRELETIRAALADLIEQCNGDQHPDCPIIEDLSSEERAPDIRRDRKPVDIPEGRNSVGEGPKANLKGHHSTVGQRETRARDRRHQLGTDSASESPI